MNMGTTTTVIRPPQRCEDRTFSGFTKFVAITAALALCITFGSLMNTNVCPLPEKPKPERDPQCEWCMEKQLRLEGKAARGDEMPIGTPITIDITATVDNSAFLESRIVDDEIETTLNGQDVPYTVITEEDGSTTILVTGD